MGDMQSQNCDSLPAPAPAVKRRRVALACDSCRTRKSRCDSHRPKCSSCTDLGFECVYTAPASASNIIVQKDYLSALESRVSQLEESLSTVQNDLSGLSCRVDQGCQPRTTSDEPGRNVQLQQDASGSMPDFTGTEDSVDAMGSITLADEEDSGFFGPSSNVAFTRHLRRAIGNSGNFHGNSTAPPSGISAYEGGFVSASRPPTPPGQRDGLRFKGNEKDIFILPPHADTLKLIRRYFADTGLLFPYIHPPTFLETYDQMVQGGLKKVRRTWLGLLNIILAMAIITTTPGGAPASTRMAESDIFYQRSLRLCGNEILRGTTLEVVQYLILMGLYLQGTQKSVQAWTVHGLAVKAALQLGLHSKDASRAFSPLERETRKRTWFGCVVLDRTLSMTFGRPAAIPESYVKLELPAQDAAIDSSTVVDEQTCALSIEFYNATITLYKQIWNVVDLLYGQNLGCDSPLSVSQTVAHVFSLEQDLFSWERLLPGSLPLINPSQLEDAHREATSDYTLVNLRLRIILTLRYLNFRSLLHRPVLMRFIDACAGQDRDPQQVQLLQQLGLSSMQICADSTMQIVDLVYDIVHHPSYSRYNLLGAWWFSLYYTFNAALVMLGILIVCRDENVAGPSVATVVDRIRKYPFRAVAALLKLDTGNRMVDRCRLYLERLISSSGIYGIDELTSGSATELCMGFPIPPITDQDISPLGVDFGEFMVDGDLFASLMSG